MNRRLLPRILRVFTGQVAAVAFIAFSNATWAGGWQVDTSFAGGTDFPRETSSEILSVLPDGRILTAEINESSYVLRRSTAGGLPDLTYGQGGTVTVLAPVGRKSLRAPVVQSDGRILLYGALDPDMKGLDQAVILRFDDRGVLDPTFATGGELLLPQPQSPVPVSSEVRAIATQPDGKLLLLELLYATPASPRMRVLRLTPGGGSDSGFGRGQGFVELTPVPAASPDSYGIDALPNGAIRVQTGSGDFVTLAADGTQLTDPARLPRLPRAAPWWRLAGIAPDGRYLLDGNDSAGHLLVARMNPDGSPDLSFGTAGTGVLTIDAGARDGAMTPASFAWQQRLTALSADGARLYLLNYWRGVSSVSRGVLLRVRLQGNSPGTLDTSFGNQGQIELPVAFAVDRIVEQSVDHLLLLSRYSSTAVRLSAAETASPGIIGFRHEYELDAKGSTARLVVSRANGTHGAVDVSFSSFVYPYSVDVDITGLYVPVAGHLTWPDGDGSDRIIELPLPTNAAFDSALLMVQLQHSSGVHLLPTSDLMQVAIWSGAAPPQGGSLSIDIPSRALSPPTVTTASSGPGTSGAGADPSVAPASSGGGGAVDGLSLIAALLAALHAVASRLPRSGREAGALRRRILSASAGMALLVLGVECRAARGDMDPTFAGGAGHLLSSIVTLQDGRFLTLQESVAGGLELSLMDAHGAAIPTWGVQGTVRLPAGLLVGFRSRAVATADQGMLLVGSRPSANGNNPRSDFVVAKLTASGQLDMAFGNGGVLTRPANPFTGGFSEACGESAQGAVIQADGRILVAVARYDDCYDASTQLRVRRFDATGRSELPFPTESGALVADQVGVGYVDQDLLRLFDDGRICVFLEVCFTAGGGDSSLFSSSPFVPPGVYDWFAVAALPGGDVLVSPTDADSPLRIWRLHRDGSPDPSFGSEGVLAIPDSILSPYPAITRSSRVERALPTADGRAVYLVVAVGPNGVSLVRVQLPAAGPARLDAAFGKQGAVWLGEVDYWWLINDVVEQPDGGLLMATDRTTFRLQGPTTAAPGVVVFSPPPSVVNAGDTINVIVSRVLGSEGAISLDYATRDGLAIAGADYRSASGRLAWADGETGGKIISVVTMAHKDFLPADVGFFLNLSSTPGGTWPIQDSLEIHVHTAAAPSPSPPAPASPTVIGSGSTGGGGGDLDPATLCLLLSGVLVSTTLRHRRAGQAREVRVAADVLPDRGIQPLRDG
jgi:uncharacterized delta-60 repeat protein